jgi:hypothetical protein
MNRTLPQEREGRSLVLPVLALAAIGCGAMVVFDGTAADQASTAADRDDFTVRGVAEESVTGGANDGDVKVSIRRGTFLFKNSTTAPITLADLGEFAFAEDGDTVAKNSATNTRARAGVIFDVDASGVWVTI